MRKLGRIGIFVSKPGFGTWGIGGNSYEQVDDNGSSQSLIKAFKLWINFFDTADIYVLENSEALIVNTFENIRE